MKKIYAALAIAIAASASASAIDTNKTQILTRTNIERVENVTVVNGAATRAAAEYDPFYIYNWRGATSSTQGWQTSSVSLRFEGNTVYAYGLCGPSFEYAVIEGTYNPDAQTIRFPKQKTIYLGEGGEPIYFYPMRINWDKDGKFDSESEQNYIELTYCPNGVQLNDGSIICVDGWVALESGDEIELNTESSHGTSNGYFWLFSLRFVPVNEKYQDVSAFRYNASDWKSIGKATLDDGWFRALTDDGKGFPAYAVDAMQNVNNANEILLVKPYGAGSPYNDAIVKWSDGTTDPLISIKDQPGYILLNIENPDVVLAVPFVNSGFYSEGYFNNIPICCTSFEGYSYYVEGNSFDDILDDYDFFDYEASTMDENGLVTLPNCRYQNAVDLNVADQWTNSQEMPIPMVSTIQLPDLAGVQGITMEQNSVKRFFNLQGVEIKNPAAGELIIVKEGAKATKTIVR